MTITAAQQSVLTDQLHNITIASAAIAAAFGWQQGNEILTGLGGLIVLVASALSSISITNNASGGSKSGNVS